MTYREWPNPWRWLTKIGQILAYNKLESQAEILVNWQYKAARHIWCIKHKTNATSAIAISDVKKRYTHKTSGFKTSGFKTSGFKTSGFKTSGLQNVRFTKRQVSKRLVSKRPVFKFDILIKQKVFVFVSFTYYCPLWWYVTKKPQKYKIKHSFHFACKHGCNITCGFPPTTSTEYLWMFFCNRTFWGPDVL